MDNINISNIVADSLHGQILDEMSDGQWHAVYKLNRRIERGNHKAKDFKVILADSLDLLVGRGILLAGNNESYRFRDEHLTRWRNCSVNPILQEKQYQPRYFGNLLEDDGWLLAQLKDYDLIHFRAEPNLAREDVKDLLSIELNAIQIEEGLFRILLKEGSEEKILQLKEFQKENPHYEINGIRLESNLKRRDLNDLPKRYLDDLVKYYGQFAKVLLRSRMTSITKHVPDNDDIQQQIYLWVLDAVQRYDAETSIPFAAYLGTLLKKWVFNLNRKSYGRSVADVELKHVRAVTAFKLEHNRDPTPEELSDVLEQSSETTKKDFYIINTVSNLRNVSSIYSEETEMQLPHESSVEQSIEDRVKSTLISAGITTAAKKQFKDKETIDGLIAAYYNTWGREYNSKRIKSWLKTAKIQELTKNLNLITSTILKKEEF